MPASLTESPDSPGSPPLPALTLDQAGAPRWHPALNAPVALGGTEL
jgi:hypothetical protein